MSYLPDNYNAIVSSKLADTMKAMGESMYPYLQTSCNAIVYSKLADTIKVMQESMHPHLQNLQASCNTALLSTLADTMKIVEESAPSIASFMQSFEAIRRSFDETIARITPQIHTVLRGVSIAIKISHVNQKLGDAQYVYWDFMQEDFIDSILENSNTNEVLEEYLDKDDYKTVKATIENCASHPHMAKHKDVMAQCVKAFETESYSLAAMGLTSIIDALLSDVSGNSTTNLKKRVDAILQKVDENQDIESDEYAFMTLFYTFDKAMEIFRASFPFEGEEPDNLNRHWLMHGRFTREKTKLDCVKLINMIYGILLIDDYCKMEAESDE